MIPKVRARALDAHWLKRHYETSLLLRAFAGICMIAALVCGIQLPFLHDNWDPRTVALLVQTAALAYGAYVLYARPAWGRAYGLVLCVSLAALSGPMVLPGCILFGLTLLAAERHFGPDAYAFADLAEETKLRRRAPSPLPH